MIKGQSYDVECNLYFMECEEIRVLAGLKTKRPEDVSEANEEVVRRLGQMDLIRLDEARRVYSLTEKGNAFLEEVGEVYSRRLMNSGSISVRSGCDSEDA